MRFIFGAVWGVSPISGGYHPSLLPHLSWTFVSSLLYHWFLPFITVFLVSLGGWAIGMRNLVIYELENDSSRYLRALGARERLIRRYAYRNASLPQLSGLALALGVVIGGNIVAEIAFHYPGLGLLIYNAITDKDFFLLQGIFIFIAYRTRASDCCPVDGVSFAVADGEIMGLAGESGCGKSTLGTSMIYLDARIATWWPTETCSGHPPGGGVAGRSQVAPGTNGP